MQQLFQKHITAAFALCACILLPAGTGAMAADLTQQWTSGDTSGAPYGIGSLDLDGDGVNDIACIKYDFGTGTTSFKAVRGEAFTDLYDWVTPPGDMTSFIEPVDIDDDGTYEIVTTSLSGTGDNAYEGTFYVYNGQTGAQVWQSSAIAITAQTAALPFNFSGAVIDVIGSDDPEWVVVNNSVDPATDETTGKITVYQKAAGGVGFSESDKLWEQTYAKGSVSFASGFHDLNRDGKADLFASFSPDAGSGLKGAVIYYAPSGATSFTEAVRFETTQAENTLTPIYTQSSTQTLYPTRVDTGIAAGVLLFLESWTDGEKKNLISAYSADSPYSQIGTNEINGRTIGVYPDDVDGDGVDELVVDTYDGASETSNVQVYLARGGAFTLSQLWETGDTSGNMYIYSHWDMNKDSKADLVIGLAPPSADTTTYGTLTSYQYTGSTFSQLYQFDAAYAGPDARFTIFTSATDTVAGPTEYLNVPMDLDCASGADLAVASTYLDYATSTEAGTVTVYNLPSQTASWTQAYNHYLNGCLIAHVQDMPSNDLLLSGYNLTISGSTMSATGSIQALSCGQTTDITTTTTTAASSTTTTAGSGATTTTASESSTTTTTPWQNPCVVEEIYGDTAPQTEALRRFRDTTLAGLPLGASAIRLYYNVSPAVTGWLRTAPVAKRMLRYAADNVLPLP